MSSRWNRLAKPFKDWRPFRISPRSGEVVEHHPWMDTTAGEIFHTSVDHPFTDRFQFIETWEGAKRWAPSISTLIRDSASGKIVAELFWRRKDESTHVVTSTGVRRFEKYADASHSFFSARPGYRVASKDAVEHSASVVKEMSGFFDASGHVDPNSRTEITGMLRREKPGSRTLVYQPKWIDNIRVTDRTPRKVRVLDGESSITLKRGELLAVAGDTYGQRHGAEVVGTTGGSKSKAIAPMHIVAIPENAKAGERFELNVTTGGHTRTIEIIADR